MASPRPPPVDLATLYPLYRQHLDPSTTILESNEPALVAQLAAFEGVSRGAHCREWLLCTRFVELSSKASPPECLELFRDAGSGTL